MEDADTGKTGNWGRVQGQLERSSKGRDLEAVPRTSWDGE
jgi:hypothetical protein